MKNNITKWIAGKISDGNKCTAKSSILNWVSLAKLFTFVIAMLFISNIYGQTVFSNPVGIGLPLAVPPAAQLHVDGPVRFDALPPIPMLPDLITIDPIGNIFRTPYVSLPPGGLDGQSLFWNNTTLNWNPNSNLLFQDPSTGIIPWSTLPTFNYTFGLPAANDAVPILADGNIGTNHDAFGTFGIYGSGHKWNSLGLRNPLSSGTPYVEGYGLNSAWGETSVNIGMALPYAPTIPDIYDGLISWQDNLAPSPLAAQNRMVFGVNNATSFEELAQIRSNGTFGIGRHNTVSPIVPTDKLHLYDYFGASLYQRWSTNSNLNTGAKIGFNSGSNVFEIRQEENSDMEFFTNNLNRMTLTTNNGYLGLGLNFTTPQDRLHLDEQGPLDNYVRWTNPSAPNGGKIGYASSSDVFEIRQEENRDMEFYANNTHIATMKDLGFTTPFMGIGASNPIGIGGFPMLTVNGDIEINGDGYSPGGGMWLASDRNIKNNITDISSDWKKILSVNSYEYFYNASDKLNFPKNKSYGFIAQEVREIIPELTKQWGDILTINYTGFIPFLSQGIKEHEDRLKDLELSNPASGEFQEQMSSLKETNEELKSQNQLLKQRLELLEQKFDAICQMPCLQGNSEKVNSQSGEKTTGNSVTLNDRAELFQNEPNPFTSTTTIRYYTPEGAMNSKVLIRNTEGKIVGEYKVEAPGHGSINILPGTLAPATYYYTLFVNGFELDTKKMTLIHN